ncbi:hypothetical protein ACIRL2_27725 [Embleya sp. NPDC127516]|uniref:hypothetical protein n=1 Tax=Embleya sp. NPDC127516 TaxID=3363990 RepID=UPI0038029B28
MRRVEAVVNDVRLDRLGIRPEQARGTALSQLATGNSRRYSPAPRVSAPTWPFAWQRLFAGDRVTYAAEVSRRTSTQEDSR